MIRVAIVEDDADVRESLRLLIGDDPGFSVVGDFGDCESALSALPATRPEVVLMDLDLPGISGIEGIRRLRAWNSPPDVLVLTIIEKDDALFQALRAGACGYLVKNDALEQVLEAIREVHRGGAPMSTQIARRVVESMRSQPTKASPLTPRENEVLAELCKGHSYRTISDALFISEETVRRHLKNIYRKLEVHSKSEAVAKAYQDRLLDS